MRQLVLEAARELFAGQGYARTTTRDIARRAGVVPSQLFVQFGTKAAVFEQAAITPYADVVNAYVQRWDAVTHDDVDAVQLCREIMEDLFDVFMRNSGLVAALVLAQEHSPDLQDELRSCRDAVDRVLAPVERFTAEEANRRGFSGVDTPITVRLNHGTVLAAALFGVFDSRPAGPPSEELARLLTDGFVPKTQDTWQVTRPDADAEPVEVTLNARLRLLDAARETFCRDGFARTGTRDLAAAANTSESVIFRHFAGKQDLFDQAVVAAWERALDATIAESRAREAGDDPIEDFRREVRALVDLFSRHRGHVLALLETRSSSGASSRALSRSFGDLSGLLRERFANAQHTEDPTLPLILCMIVGATVLDGWVFAGANHSPDWTTEQVTRLALYGLAHQT